jgi:hypothetical protein
MSPTTMIILNAVLDCAVIAVLAYVMHLPSRLGRHQADNVLRIATDQTLQHRRAA